ncbi:MAG: c-type cytochrome [Rhizobiales bacterium]|nr:c-type cytochrome [Hyphomicrobiales bacterium]
MSGFLGVTTYAVGLISLFTAFSYYGIPQLVPEPPPAKENSTGTMTTEELVAMGSRIYARACVLCHSGVGDRAPKLDAIGTVWRERTRDVRYRGSARTLEDYLRESMLEPSAYVVSGFGKPGTNDAESPMPAAATGAMALSASEINAVIGYLQSMAGDKVTVTLLPDPVDRAKPSAPASEPSVAAKAPDAISALRKFQCDVCHALPKFPVEEGEQRPGPDLRGIWKTAGHRVDGMDAKGFISESILFPNKKLAQGFEPDLMPNDYGDQMLVAELQLIVDYLAQEH